MTAAYLFFNYNCILLCEIRFSDRWEHSIAQICHYGNLAVLQCQEYFLKVALKMSLFRNYHNNFVATDAFGQHIYISPFLRKLGEGYLYIVYIFLYILY